MNDNISRCTKKESTNEMKKNIVNKWQRGYTLSESAGRIPDWVAADRIGKRSKAGAESKQDYEILNQLLSGHTLLNDHMAKINSSRSRLCEEC